MAGLKVDLAGSSGSFCYFPPVSVLCAAVSVLSWSGLIKPHDSHNFYFKLKQLQLKRFHFGQFRSPGHRCHLRKQEETPKKWPTSCLTVASQFPVSFMCISSGKAHSHSGLNGCKWLNVYVGNVMREFLETAALRATHRFSSLISYVNGDYFMLFNSCFFFQSNITPVKLVSVCIQQKQHSFQ